MEYYITTYLAARQNQCTINWVDKKLNNNFSICILQ